MVGLEGLTDIEIVVGIFDTLIVLISLIIGLKLISKYFANKEIALITVGLAMIFFSIGFTAGTFSFFLYILFGATLDRTIFLILAGAFSPLAIICWVYSFCTLLYPRLTKILVSIYVIISVIYEILLFIWIFNSPDSLGTFYGTYYFRPKPFPLVFYSFGVATLLVTGILFTKESFKSNDKRFRWRGRFLLLAFVSVSISMAIEGLVYLPAYALALVRVIHIAGTFEYYMGFFLPDRIAKLLIKEE
ncbi:MAG: hypothetical protein ACW98D_20250 [Promethearchaeota archaeon]|jgi:hypothetical protein